MEMNDPATFHFFVQHEDRSPIVSHPRRSGVCPQNQTLVPSESCCVQPQGSLLKVPARLPGSVSKRPAVRRSAAPSPVPSPCKEPGPPPPDPLNWTKPQQWPLLSGATKSIPAVPSASSRQPQQPESASPTIEILSLWSPQFTLNVTLLRT